MVHPAVGPRDVRGGLKGGVLGMVQAFFPDYDYEIREIVPWEDGKRALLERARQAAAR